MSIRKYSNPRDLDLSYGLQKVLRNNGMQAHISVAPNGELNLIVLGHDSPAITYKITDQQAESLMNWGNNYADKKAYNTFNSIVKNDFHLPDNYVSARNAGGVVMMGLNGYRIHDGEYGYHAPFHRPTPYYRPFGRSTVGWGGDFIGWRPRHFSGPHYGGFFPGFHGRRIGGQYFSLDGPLVAERPDGRRKPGELRSGGYGYYYKGQQNRESSPEIIKPAKEIKLQPLKAAERPPQGQAIPLKEHIASNYYFTKDKFQEVLESHGIKIDEKKGEIYVQSSATRVDMQYYGEQTKKEIATILADKLDGANGVSYEKRLEALNRVLGDDFAGKVTIGMLNSKEIINIDLKPEVKEVAEAAFIKRDKEIAAQQERLAERQRRDDAIAAERNRLLTESDRIDRDIHAINGREIHEIMGNKGFFTATEHGRGLVVGEIRVDETMANNFVMSAVINGVNVEHSISKKQYDEFLQLDDKHRLQLFDKVFDEVAIKNDHGGRDMAASPVVAVNIDGKTEYISREQMDIDHATATNVDGSVLSEMNHKKGFYREINNGREVNVGQIYVERVAPEKILSIDNPTFRENAREKVNEVVDNYISDFKAQHPDANDDKIAEERNKIQPLALKYVWNLEEGMYESPVKGMTAQDITQYADRVATAKVMGENGFYSKEQIDNGSQELKEFYKTEYDKAFREAQRNAEDYQKPDNDVKYRMTAYIDGVPVVHEISQKDYNKFLAVDDTQRLHMFSKLFSEVEIKTRPEMRTNVGAAIMAALVTGVEVAADVALAPARIVTGQNPAMVATDIAARAADVHLAAQRNFDNNLAVNDSDNLDDVYRSGRGV